MDITTIGTLARCFCGVGRDQVEQAAQMRGSLGKALVATGALTRPQLEDLLVRQRAMRNGAASPSDISQLVDFAIAGLRSAGERWAQLIRTCG